MTEPAKAPRAPGHELSIWMAERRLSVKEFAAMLDCQRPYLSRLRYGKGKPGRAMARLIEELTEGRVSSSAWDD